MNRERICIYLRNVDVICWNKKTTKYIPTWLKIPPFVIRNIVLSSNWSRILVKLNANNDHREVMHVRKICI